MTTQDLATERCVKLLKILFNSIDLFPLKEGAPETFKWPKWRLICMSLWSWCTLRPIRLKIFPQFLFLLYDSNSSLYSERSDGRSLFRENFPFASEFIAAVAHLCLCGRSKNFSFIYSFNSWPIPKQMSLSLDSTFSPEMPWSSKGIHMSTKLVTLNQEFRGRCVRQFLKISSWNGCAADIVFLAIRFSPADE